MLKHFHDIFRNLLALERITIAAVNGHCLGGGCELAAFCDIVIATDDAQFGQPEINVGCYPPVAAALLPVLVGRKRATEWILTGNSISAQAAQAAGLINRVVPKGELDAAVENFIKILSQKSPIVLKLAKRSLLQGSFDFLSALGRTEEIYLEQLIKTDDVKEGINAFLEKRTPVWAKIKD
jgi:cyclohexa-1,5-dienecarbonyl-CoA hydratase